MRQLRFVSLLAAGFVFAASVRAQTTGINTPIYSNAPVVTITAPVRQAYESGTSGVFRITRSGWLSNDLYVWFSVGGSASNGVDFEAITNHNVLIPAGTNSAYILVKPIDDMLVEPSESVVLRVEPSPLMSPIIQYLIGTPSEALVTIVDNDTPPTNHPPTVRITQPASNSVFIAPTNITIVADPHDVDGVVTTVEFFSGTNSLGSVFNDPRSERPALPWQITWSNVPPGTYSLRAKATDNEGAIGWSPSVFISVHPKEEPRAIISVTNVGDSFVGEGGASGIFRIRRGGNTNVALTVFYKLSGTAGNGVDYTALSNSVAMAAGATFVDIMVDPIDDALVEPTENVILSIVPPVCPAIYPPPPECYTIGTPGSATILIHDNDVAPTNTRPTVRIDSPTNHSEFSAPADIQVTVTAGDADGSLRTIDVFAGNMKIGTVETDSPPGQSITVSFAWNGVGPGQYLLMARATDTQGGTNFSQGVAISVRGTNTPPETNLPIVTVTAIDAFAIEGPVTNYFGSNVPPHIDGTNIMLTNWCTLRTNAWQTNTATFLVRRGGNTNSSITITYALGGTASNGVDYLALPGSVTIPAGERSARVVISPIDDVLREGVETMVFHLVPSPTAVLPTYIIGRPSEAAAIIIDNDVPRPGTRRLSDALFHICKDAPNGFIYRLEYSTNLIDWTVVETNVVTEGAVEFVDPEATTTPTRFYRVVPELALPPE